MIHKEALVKGLQIYNILKTKGIFRRDDDTLLFNEYFDEDVRYVLNEIQRTNKVNILIVNNELHMIPEMDNELHRYTNQELRDILKLKNNGELFTVHFIWMVTLSKFFGEQYERTGEPRAYLPIDEIMDQVNETIEVFKGTKADKLEELTEEFQYSLISIVETWDNLGHITENTKSIGRSSTKDHYFINKALRFWEDEKIITIYDETEVRLTERGRVIPEYHYHQEDTINKLHRLIEEAKENQLNNIDSDEEQTLLGAPI